MSTAQFRKHFGQACEALGLARTYVPHSLRHGGATHDQLRGIPLDEILRHGRWASAKSARHYIQAGKALLLNTAVPDHVLELAAVLVPNLLKSFALSQRHGVGAGVRGVNHM